jgi:hypothetical protein
MLNRPTAPSRSDFHSVYVALTRVRSGNDFMVIGQADDLAFLDGLRPHNDLLSFLEGLVTTLQRGNGVPQGLT